MPAKRLPDSAPAVPNQPVIGVFATGDPRVDETTRVRCANIIAMTADLLAKRVKLPSGQAVSVVYAPTLVDGEKQADQVARQLQAEGVNILVCVPDTWAFPQLSLISLVQQFPADTPINLTCGNSGPKPGVVFAHAGNGALAQYGRLSHLNVGSWPDTGMKPKMSDATAEALVDWCYAAVTRIGLKGRRVVVFGHDSMGMETALAHILPTRKAFGLEITRLDMKLLADMLNKGAYEADEVRALRRWCERMVGPRLEIAGEAESQKFNQGLAMYLIVRDLLKDLNAVGGGFMNQLEWGSDRRGLPLPIVDLMESLLNSGFDHQGKKEPVPFATEADTQGLLTMLPFTWLTAGNPPLFMDFRKVWEPWELQAKAEEIGLGKVEPKALWRTKGLVDGDNSGSAALDWAALPGAKAKDIMANVYLPPAEDYYFPGGGNSVSFVSPAGIDGIAGRMAYSADAGIFSLVWDEATTVLPPKELVDVLVNLTNVTWPHTFVTPKYATMGEYKQYAPANHFHMVWGLAPARLQYWMDLSNVLSVTPWQARPGFLEGVDRPLPLLYLINGGESVAKLARAK
jgi:L-fucose isomerase